jgi:hypothetical protein
MRISRFYNGKAVASALVLQYNSGEQNLNISDSSVSEGKGHMFSRRDFLTSSSLLCGSVGFSGPASIFAAASKPSGYFGVHPFVERHPEAVFILRTHVDYKTNSGACKRAGLDFGRSVWFRCENQFRAVS